MELVRLGAECAIILLVYYQTMNHAILLLLSNSISVRNIISGIYLGQWEKIKKIRDLIKKNSINKRIYDNKTMKYQSK